MNKRFLAPAFSIGKKKGHPKYNKAISKILALGLLIIVCVVIAVGAYYAFYALPKESTPTPTPKPTTPTETPEPQKPDLEIRDMYVYPSQPQAGTQFTVQVNVANIGETKSGSYDLAVWIKDVSQGYTYPVGTFRQDSINPNYQVIWSSEPLVVDFAGAHQLWAEITPFNFEEGDDSNNMQGLAFTVTS